MSYIKTFATLCVSIGLIISKEFKQSANEFNIELYKRMQSAEESALRAIGRR